MLENKNALAYICWAMCTVVRPRRNLSISDFLPTLLNYMLLKSFLGIREGLEKIPPKTYAF